MSLQGLYVITGDRSEASWTLTDGVEQALRGGARLVQYRDKSTERARRDREAAALVQLCRRYRTPLIVNDDLELARAVEADGVHLGREDGDPAAARQRLGRGKLIGVSCYNRFDLAVAAAEAGADYVAFGSFFPSPTKPQAVRADPELLRRARRSLPIPVVAIGGITPENGRALITAGADMLAVISAVFDQADISAAARDFSDLFEQPEDNAP